MKTYCVTTKASTFAPCGPNASSTYCRRRTSLCFCKPLLLLLACCIVGMLGAQSRWVDITPAAGPLARFWSAATTHGGSLLVFGGGTRSNYAQHADTWVLDQGAWNLLAPSQSPSARSGHGLVHDTQRGLSLLFGGYDGRAPHLDDTWTFDGVTWTRVSPAQNPGARSGHAMVYDPKRQLVVLFGGATKAAPRSDDTWTFDGTTWSLVPTTMRPRPRAYHGMAWDGVSERVLLFGGYDTAALGDTWVFDGSDWREVTSGPKARYGAALCYDPLRERVVLQGGFAKSMPDDTWEWDGSTWTENPASPQPPSVGYAAIGYDPGGQRVVRCFGEAGAQATKIAWSFATTQVAGYRSYGLSCAGSTTTALLAGGKELPWIGDQHEYRLRDALPNAPVAFVLGLSDRRWSGFDLPIDLTVLGAGACSLYASMDLVIGLATTAGGTVSVPVTLPPIATLGGARFYTQFFAFDLAANTLGMTFTNGVEATIGIR